MQAQLLHGMWDLSSPTRDQTWVPRVASWILNFWITMEIPVINFNVLKCINLSFCMVKVFEHLI